MAPPLTTASGEAATIAWQVAFVGDGFLLSGVDISDRVRAESTLARRESLARLGEMAAVVAHEVRNPLAGIGGVLQAVATNVGADTSDGQMLESAHERLVQLSDAMERLLHYARPVVPEFERIDLRALAERVAVGAGAEVRVTGAEAWVFGDTELLAEAVRNLVTNAVQATSEGGHVRVITGIEGLDATIRVVDEGPGMPDVGRARACEPFYTTRVHGSGLGLAIVQRTVEAHQGSVEVLCPGGGATFTLRFPSVRRASPSAPVSRAAVSP